MEMNNNKVSNGYVSKPKDIVISKVDENRRLPKETVPNSLINLAQTNPHFPVLKYKSHPDKNYDMTLTMEQYLKLIEKAAMNFIQLGLDAKAAVGIIGFNHPAWFISELGAIFAGGVGCGIYTTNTADICKFIMNDSNCQIVVVENDEQLNKVISVLPGLPQLKAIIKYTGSLDSKYKNTYAIPIYTWEEFLDIKSSSNLSAELENRKKNLKPEDCALLIYTSGTTGFPKGVMLSHDNMIFTVKMAMEHMCLDQFQHSIISYLPLSHIAANLIDIISTVTIGVTIYFAQPDALKGTLGKTLKEVRPTIFIAVPRVFEKIQEQMQEIGAKSSNIRRRIAIWAKSVGYRNSLARIAKKSPDISYYIARCLVFRKVKAALGLDRCEYLASAAAPLMQQTLDFFISLDLMIHQIYGMSECCGPHTIGTSSKMKLGSAGTLLKGVEMKIHEPGENNIGEICMRGRHVFIGYYNAEEKTRETIDSEGWLHSGDLGKIEDDDLLIITGRIKELIVTAGGENIAPVPIEEKIKEKLGFVNNVMLVGDKQKFISCLLTLKTNVDPDTQSVTDILTPAAVRSLKEIGITAANAQEILEMKDSVLKDFIDNVLKQVNSLSVSRAAHIQKWSFLPRDFSINGGELGPTMKLKRMVIEEKYSNIINSMYSNSN